MNKKVFIKLIFFVSLFLSGFSIKAEDSSALISINFPPATGGRGDSFYLTCKSVAQSSLDLCNLARTEGLLANTSASESAKKLMSGIENTAKAGKGAFNVGFFSSINLGQACLKAKEICVAQCNSSISQAKADIALVNSTSDDTVSTEELASLNSSITNMGSVATKCESVLGAIVTVAGWDAVEQSDAIEQFKKVQDATKSNNNLLVGGAVAVGAYLLGKDQGRKSGRKGKGKDLPEVEAVDEDADKDKGKDGKTADSDEDSDAEKSNVVSNACSTEESVSLPNCQESFLRGCNYNPNLDHCTAFTEKYCDSQDDNKDHAFCRKMAANNYCSQSDGVNRNSCPSCRELANNFSGQYAPEDLAQACGVCSTDPICVANEGSMYAYRNQSGSAPGSSLETVILPAGTNGSNGNTAIENSSQRYSNDVYTTGRRGASGSSANRINGNSNSHEVGKSGNATTGSNGSNVSGTSQSGNLNSGVSSGQSSGVFSSDLASSGSARPFAMGEGSNSVDIQVPNSYGIASAFSPSSFKIHSDILRKNCLSGSMIGCF